MKLCLSFLNSLKNLESVKIRGFIILVGIWFCVGFTLQPEKFQVHQAYERISDWKYQIAPDFKLEDLNGETVHLKDLKGKVVILDFWATWCLPCIKSFPAMKMVEDRYKDDKEVVFLYINTWEQSPNPKKKVKDFLAKRNLDLFVLLDYTDPELNHFKVAELYQLKGIPSKFIIDRKGIIQNQVAGFAGDDQDVVSELVEMIELARRY